MGPSRASADDVASERDTMALLALLDWVPPLPIPFVARFLPGAIAKADLNNYDRDTSATQLQIIAKADLNNYDRDTSATRLQSCFLPSIVTSRRPKENAFAVHICTLQPKKIPNCNRVPRSPRYDSKTYVMVPKRTNLAPKQTLWLQNSSREDPPEYASAAWDHWTGRDCATGRPSRSLCLDLTSGPPLDAPASHSHPTP